MNQEKSEAPKLRSLLHSDMKCRTAACRVYDAHDDVVANGAACCNPRCGHVEQHEDGGEGYLPHDLSVQTMQGEIWGVRMGGAERGLGGDAYQSDDSGPGPGARHDVQVVGQVELEEKCHGCFGFSTWKSDCSDVLIL